MALGGPTIATNQKKEITGPPGPPFLLTSANNGVSVDTVSKKIVLGNALADPLQEALLLDDREIPIDPGTSNGIFLNDATGTGDSVQLAQDRLVVTDLAGDEAFMRATAINVTNAAGSGAAIMNPGSVQVLNDPAVANPFYELGSGATTVSIDMDMTVDVLMRFFQQLPGAMVRFDFTNKRFIFAANATADNGKTMQIEGSVSIKDGTLVHNTMAFTNGAGASVGTLTNAPAAGNPTKWIPIDDNGTTRFIPAW